MTDDTGGLGFDFEFDLLGLEMKDDFARLDGCTVGHTPFGDRAFGHRHAKLWN